MVDLVLFLFFVVAIAAFVGCIAAGVLFAVCWLVGWLLHLGWFGAAILSRAIALQIFGAPRHWPALEIEPELAWPEPGRAPASIIDWGRIRVRSHACDPSPSSEAGGGS